MKRRPYMAILNSYAATNVVDDTTAKHYFIAKTSGGTDDLLGPFKYGKTSKVESIDPAAEVRQMALIDGGSSKETVTADTRYKIVIGRDRYESTRLNPVPFAYRSPATLTGTAATDRANLYTALAAKVNANTAINAVAYTLTSVDFTLGTDGAGTALNFTVGETVTQATSSETAKVAKSTIASGTMAGNDAAGTIWLIDISDKDAWLTIAVTLTGGTSLCVVTQTDATTVHDTGLSIWDNAGYWLNPLGREGRSLVTTAEGFQTATTEISAAAVYAQGIGSDLAAKTATLSRDARDVTNNGFLDYVSIDGTLFDTSNTYREYIITVYDGDEDALAAEHQRSYYEYHLFVNYADADLAAFDAALAAAAAK